jgi:hypothetical protein
MTLALLVTTVSTGCQTKQSRENERLHKLQANIFEAGRRHFTEKMKRLKVGMDPGEVERILGPLDSNYKTLMEALIERRRQGVAITFENGEKGAMHIVDDPPDGHLKSLYTYHGGGFTLVFDWDGKLKEFYAEKADASQNR